MNESTIDQLASYYPPTVSVQKCENGYLINFSNGGRYVALTLDGVMAFLREEMEPKMDAQGGYVGDPASSPFVGNPLDKNRIDEVFAKKYGQYD